MTFITKKLSQYVESALFSDQATDQLTPLRQALQRGGITNALRYLNNRVPYRYTGLYKFQGDMVRNVFLYDRHQQPDASLLSAPKSDSLCQYISPGAPFHTNDATSDPRIAGNLTRDLVRSYYGVGLSRSTHRVIGSLCHFDPEKKFLPKGEAAFLNVASRMLMAHMNGFDD